MLILSDDQFRQLGFEICKEAVRTAVNELSSWRVNKSEAELQNFIEAMAAFAAARGVHATPNIHRLILCKITHGFPDQPGDFLEMLLSRPGFSEAYRVEQFCKAVADGDGVVKVTLESDIESLRAEHG